MRGGRVTAIRHHGRPISPADSAPSVATIGRHLVLVLALGALLIAAFAHPVDTHVAVTTNVAVSDAATIQQVRASTAAKLSTLEAAVASAQTAWDGSDDRVLDESARASLQAAIADAQQAVDEVRSGVVWPGTSLETAAAADAATIADAKATLASGVTGVDEAVAAWEAEQARLAAEAEAARRAAEEAAAAARAAAPRHSAAAGGAGMHLESIWTSGGQAQLDACRGAVNVSPVASYLGAGFYAAEHWSCGGSAWGGIGAGALVEFAGYGTYQVAGRIGGLSYGVDASVLPGGYAGYYQTCVGGSSSNMTVWLLTRVG